jgi:hypothetical protein
LLDDDPDGDALGAPVDIPHDAGMLQLHCLVNVLLNNEEKLVQWRLLDYTRAHRTVTAPQGIAGYISDQKIVFIKIDWLQALATNALRNTTKNEVLRRRYHCNLIEFILHRC